MQDATWPQNGLRRKTRYYGQLTLKIYDLIITTREYVRKLVRKERRKKEK